MCAWGLKSLDACVRLDADSNASENLHRQCREITPIVNDRHNFTTLESQLPLPEFMQQTRDLVQLQLRGITWQNPPIVLLMPIPAIWRGDANADGLRTWAQAILKPLEEEGTIRVIDATDFFAGYAKGGCAEFADFYHQNAKGRAEFSDWLLPQIDQYLYQQAVTK